MYNGTIICPFPKENDAMKVQSIQTQNLASAGEASGAVGTADFSSYINSPASLDAIFQEAANAYGISVNLLKAVAKAESDFDPGCTSHSGAMGIMQLMPGTARELGVSDAYDPYQNIMGGAKYLSQMLARYDGNVPLALAAYNAGSGNVAKYGGIPPFKETQNYVAKITRFLQGEVQVPNVSYAVSRSATAPQASSISKAATEGASAEDQAAALHEDSYYENVLARIFSYQDYIDFLEIYLNTRSREEEEAKAKERQEQQEDKTRYAYQEIRYNPVVLSLLGSGGIE